MWKHPPKKAKDKELEERRDEYRKDLPMDRLISNRGVRPEDLYLDRVKGQQELDIEGDPQKRFNRRPYDFRTIGDERHMLWRLDTEKEDEDEEEEGKKQMHGSPIGLNTHKVMRFIDRKKNK